MKTIEEAAGAFVKEWNGYHLPQQSCFVEGARFAQRWIPIEEELPEIKTEPYQVLCKLAINGQYETYWVDHDTKNIEDECTHWQPIKHD